MRRLLPDINVEGVLRALLSILDGEEWRDFWTELHLRVFNFDELGLTREANDREVWNACQENDVILVTANRNADDVDSLEVVLRTNRNPRCWPVFTLADPQRILQDREYAARNAVKLLERLDEIELYRGVGRIFVP
ncbi:MAG: DUF5615 family PIN-like protein [Planctomycetaceae bacterium]